VARRGTLVYAVAAAAFIRTIALWYALHPHLIPDTGLYAAGGIGLYPSPLGRLAGSLGLDVLAWVNAAAVAGTVLAAAHLARRYNGSPVLAALCVFFAPLAAWTIFPGVDALGALAVLLVLLWGSPWVLVTACVHLAALPVAVGVYIVRTRNVYVGAVALAIGLVLALMTPYAEVFRSTFPVEAALRVGAQTGLIIFATLVPLVWWLRRSALRLEVAAAVGAAVIVAAIVGAREKESNARYGLPVAMVAAAAAGAVPRPGGRVVV